MATIFKCKMCGGKLEIAEGASVCSCDYCGTEQTLPRLDSEKKSNLYDRANHFRRNNDFDKAMGIYDQILNEDNTDSEAYWSILLCRYGIQYVEDPANHKRIPTVNRAQYTSIYADEDYKSAILNADELQKTVYEQEAKVIDEIQKGILAISEKEEPFDVFICYKETDELGRRTPDSVLANELYHLLTQEGFKVFFSRITLEDKLGQEYEPYIFAALNSAKVMVVLGTKPAYFNAVWVKNEWSRYLALIRGGAKKMLIPAYKDMDPYDLPEEFSHLQAQDMTKLGFMWDLIRGIKKILGENQTTIIENESVVIQKTINSNISTLIKRGKIALEDGEWEKADVFFEEVLNCDAECGEAYWGKLLAKYQCNNSVSLKHYFVNKYSTTQNERLFACEEDKISLKNALDNYVVKGYLEEDKIRQMYFFDRSYLSELNCRKMQKSEVWEELTSEKLLVRAKEYSDAKINKEIDNMLSDIEDIFDERIRKAEINDKEKIENIRNMYEEHINKINTSIEELYDDANKKSLVKIKKRKICFRLVVPFVVCILLIFITTYIIIPIRKCNKEINNIKNAKVGDIVEFGNYGGEQKWRVLAIDDGKVLMICQNSIENKAYDDIHSYASWDNCTLRKWLNSTYFENAFSHFEKDYIIETLCFNAYENVTKDKIFILTEAEAIKYSLTENGKTGINWWLRSQTGNTADIVLEDGSIIRKSVDSYECVRPVIWISIE